MQCLYNNMEKINYHKEMLKELDSLDYKPSLLLHSCCAPCATYPLTLLTKYFDVTILYSNSNIYPFEEYIKRFEELKKYIKEYYPDIKIIEKEYKHEEYMSHLEKGKDMPEGKWRCFKCYSMRIEDALKYASNNNYDYVCTVLSVSRFKNSQAINKIGKSLVKKYPNVKYLVADFKKDKGTEKGIKLAAEASLYRQQYCGCEYSIRKEEQDSNK